MALTKVSTPAIKDEAITLAKLLHGDSNSNGKFLRANNGADPTFETIDLTSLSASNLTSGTIPDARFPSALPAIDGSALTGITSTTINNNADNRLITGSGTANTLEAESNLIYDGLRLGINRTPTTNADYPLQIKSANATAFAHFRSSQSEGDDPNSNGGLVGLLNDDMYLWGRESSSRIIFGTNNAERMRLDASGNLGIGTTNPQANLHLQVSGTDAPIAQFSSASYTGYVATAHADNNIGNGSKAGNLVLRGQTGVAIMGNNGTTTQVKVDSDGLKFNNDTAAANALNDYEEGTWTPQIKGTGGAGTVGSYAVQTGKYIKIGRLVYLTAEVNWSSGSANGELRITNLPFSPTTDCEGIGNAMFNNVNIGGDTANISPYVGATNTYMYFYQSRQGAQTWNTLGYDGSGAIIMNVAFRVA